MSIITKKKLNNSREAEGNNANNALNDKNNNENVDLDNLVESDCRNEEENSNLRKVHKIATPSIKIPKLSPVNVSFLQKAMIIDSNEDNNYSDIQMLDSVNINGVKMRQNKNLNEEDNISNITENEYQNYPNSDNYEKNSSENKEYVNDQMNYEEDYSEIDNESGVYPENSNFEVVQDDSEYFGTSFASRNTLNSRKISLNITEDECNITEDDFDFDYK